MSDASTSKRPLAPAAAVGETSAAGEAPATAEASATAKASAATAAARAGGVGATVHTPVDAIEASFALTERGAGEQMRPRWWGELIVVAWLAVLYDVVTGLAPMREALARTHGRSIFSFERSLGIDPELTLNKWLAGHHTLGAVASYYYDNAHFIVTFALLGWLWWRRADIYRPLRSTLVTINLIGLLVFWVCPVAPPRMLAAAGFSDVVATSHTLGSWHTGSLATDADQFGAMPSLHLAWAVWCGLVIWRLSSRRWARVLALAYPLLTAVVVLSTGNHYLLDVLAGVATFGLAAGLVWLASAASVRLPWNLRGRALAGDAR